MPALRLSRPCLRGAEAPLLFLNGIPCQVSLLPEEFLDGHGGIFSLYKERHLCFSPVSWYPDGVGKGEIFFRKVSPRGSAPLKRGNPLRERGGGTHARRRTAQVSESGPPVLRWEAGMVFPAVLRDARRSDGRWFFRTDERNCRENAATGAALRNVTAVGIKEEKACR